MLYRVPYSDGNIRLKTLVHQRNEDLSQYFFEDDEGPWLQLTCIENNLIGILYFSVIFFGGRLSLFWHFHPLAKELFDNALPQSSY